MTTLTCIIDLCPISQKSVDMRKCCANPPCKFYAAEPWSQCGKVDCNHPNASLNPNREAYRKVFRLSGGQAFM